MFALRRTRAVHSLKCQATSWQTAFDCQQEQEFGPSPTSKNSLGPRQPPVQQASAIFSPCVKLPGCKAERLSPNFANIKTALS